MTSFKRIRKIKKGKWYCNKYHYDNTIVIKWERKKGNKVLKIENYN